MTPGREDAEICRVFVGCLSGFFALPDIDSPNGISGLHAICRVCRVLLGGESFQEIGGSNSTDQ